jgi:hypothetical protein
MDGSRLAALGWRAAVPFADGLPATATWYRDNERWWRTIRDGAWDTYYARQYGARLAAGEPVPAPPGWGSAADGAGSDAAGAGGRAAAPSDDAAGIDGA